MFEVVGFGIFVAIFVTCMVIPIWVLSVEAVTRYIEYMYNKAVPPPTNRHPHKVGKKLKLALMRPLDSVLQRVRITRDSGGDIDPAYAAVVMAGGAVWLFLTLSAFVPVLVEGNRIPRFVEYGYFGSHVHHISVWSMFAAKYLSSPLLIMTGLILGHNLLVRVIRFGATIVHKFNKLPD